MSKHDEHRAKEAEMLLGNGVLMQAFNDVRFNALEALATADPEDKNYIIHLQTKAGMIDEVCEELRVMMLVISQQEQPMA